MSDRFYGIFDPLIESTEHIANCAKCRYSDLFCCYEIPNPEQLPGIITKKDHPIIKKAYFVKCSNCGSRGLACKKDWQAVIEWNKSPLSQKFNYRDFPIFGLKNLSKNEAKARLVEIRSDLETRKKEKIVSKDRLYNQHYERIRAFLAWAIYAQTIIKLSPDDLPEITEAQPLPASPVTVNDSGLTADLIPVDDY